MPVRILAISGSLRHASSNSALVEAVRRLAPASYNQSAFLLAGVPIFEIRRVEGATGMLVRDVRVGAALAQTLGDKAVALMRGHGLVVVAPSLPEAVARSVYVDINARVQAQAIALGGTIKYIGAQDVTTPSSAEPASGVRRNWDIWKHRAMGR